MRKSTKPSGFRRIALAAGIATASILSGIGFAETSNPRPDGLLTAHAGSQELISIQPNERGLYIVGLQSPPLALQDGSDLRFQAIPRGEDGRPDFNSRAAQLASAALEAEQNEFLSRVGSQMGRSVEPIAPKFTFQHAFNGFVLQLSPEELAIVAADPAVSLIEGYMEHELQTDVGPLFIGAPAIWDGSATLTGFRSRGEGVVVGIIDSGANLGSPSFAATDMEGFTHTNPLGEGNFLGWCNPLNPNHDPERDVCNSKLIGGYDFVGFVVDNPSFPGAREAPGFEDENGHGSHVASTAAGNIRTAVIDGVELEIQGVAPRANLVVFDACYTNAAGQGLCPNVSTLASINQAVADGVVDVLNFSISGGAQPWTEANPLAFLAAQNAGIFVSASAGNSGPGASTVGHRAPWVSTVAASTHTRTAIGNPFSLTGPGAPPEVLTGMPTRSGVNPPVTNTLPLNNVPLIVSPTFANAQADGCSAFPAGTFERVDFSVDPIFATRFEEGEPVQPSPVTGGIALLRWPAGTSDCGTIVRANNAAAAGAQAVVFLPETAVNAAGGANVPVFVLFENERHQPLLDAIAANPATVGTIDADRVAFVNPDAGDVMAGFSSRGPSAFDVLKPDVTAPGVAILAAVSRWNRATAPGTLVPELGDAVGLLQGTSMSSPHNAGAAALVRAVNRSWTPSEIKSAMKMTSIQAIRKEDGSTPGDAFDFGAGRIDLNNAARAGFVMNETGANFQAANPATGGDPAQLNLASFKRSECIGVCTFDRSIRATRTGVTWTATIEGLPEGSATVTPATLAPTSTTTSTPFSLAIDSAELPPDVWSFGQLVWTPSVEGVPVARMPIAIRASGPSLDVSLTEISEVVEIDAQQTVQITIANTGNPPLVWEILSDGFGPATFIDQGPQLGNGFRGSEHASSVLATGYAADDFDLFVPGTVTYLQSNGFVLPGTANLANATAITFRIYADDNGIPAGAPRNDGTNVGQAPVWEASVVPGSQGLNIATGGGNGNISLDLIAAGLTPPSLDAGKYWMVVTPTLPGSGSGANAANRLWAAAIVGVGQPVNGLAPRARSSALDAAWNIPTLTGAPGPGPASGFSMIARGTVQCGASWLSAEPASGSLGLGGVQQVIVTLDAAGLTEGTYQAALCIDSNGGSEVIPVTLTVRPTALFDFSGFDELAEGAESIVSVNIQAVSIDPDTPIRYRVILTDEGGNGVPAQPYSSCNDGVACTDRQVLPPTDAEGVTFFGPSDGVPAGSVGILEPEGQTTWFAFAPVQAGDQRLEVEILDVTNPGSPVVIDSGSITFDVEESRALVQVAHLAPFAPTRPGTAVDIFVNGEAVAVLTNVRFGDSTGYLPVPVPLPSANVLIEVVPVGETEPAISSTVMLTANANYSVLAVGGANEQALALIALEDDMALPAEGNFNLRLGHAAPFASGSASADIRLADDTVILSGVEFGEASAFLPQQAGSYDLIITAPGGTPVLIDPIELSFAAGTIISAFAIGDGENEPLGVFAWPAGAPGFFVPLNQADAQNAVADFSETNSPNLSCAAANIPAMPFRSFELAPYAYVNALSWSTLLETQGGAFGSWAEEAVILIGATSRRAELALRPGATVDRPTDGAEAFFGSIADLSGLDLDFALDADGLLWLSFCETFLDDIEPNAIWREPSFFTINPAGAEPPEGVVVSEAAVENAQAVFNATGQSR